MKTGPISVGREMEEHPMKLKVVIHEAEEGGFWAEVPAIPGCMTQGETIKELIENLYDAVEGCLSIDMDKIQLKQNDTVMELAV
jgi:predicted RNase H-like HicB family nuclease